MFMDYGKEYYLGVFVVILTSQLLLVSCEDKSRKVVKVEKKSEVVDVARNRFTNDGAVIIRELASVSLISYSVGWSRNGKYFIVGESGKDNMHHFCIWKTETLTREKCVAKLNPSFWSNSRLGGLAWHGNYLFVVESYHVGGLIYRLDIGGWENSEFSELDLLESPKKLKKLPIDGWDPFWDEKDNILFFSSEDFTLSAYKENEVENVLDGKCSWFFVEANNIWCNDLESKILRFNRKTNTLSKVDFVKGMEKHNRLRGARVSVDNKGNMLIYQDDGWVVYYNPDLKILRGVFYTKDYLPNSLTRFRISPNGSHAFFSLRRYNSNKTDSYHVYTAELSKLLETAAVLQPN